MSQAYIFNAIRREAALAAELLASGATIIGKADYKYHAYYEQAFFSLSTGLERACKLLIIINYALLNNGQFPSNSDIKKYKHDLIALFEETKRIAESRESLREINLPCLEIHKNIIYVLSKFSNNITRYYNIDLLTGGTKIEQLDSPQKEWFQKVVIPILEIHYKDKLFKRHVERAKNISYILEYFTRINVTTELDETLQDIYSASLHDLATTFAKPYVRMYTLQIIRFISLLAIDISNDLYKTNINYIPYISDFFRIFNNDDKTFFRRKTWSIYS